MKLASLRQHALLYPTVTLLSWQRQKRNSKPNQTKPLSATAALRKFAGFDFGFAVAFDLQPLGEAPQENGLKWIKKRNMSERSELVSLPT